MVATATPHLGRVASSQGATFIRAEAVARRRFAVKLESYNTSNNVYCRAKARMPEVV